MKRITLLLVAVALLGLHSCKKMSTTEEPDPNQPKSIEDLSISDDFDFSSTKTQKLQIQLPTTVDNAKHKTKIEVRTAPIAENGKLLQSMTANSNGYFEGDVEIPDYLESITVSTKYRTITTDLNGNKSTLDGIIDFGDDYHVDILPPDTTIDGGEKSFAIETDFAAVSGDSKTNVIGNGDFSQNNFGVMNWWNSNHPIDGKWYKTNYYNYGSVNWKQSNGNGYIETPNNSYPYFVGGVAQMIDAEPGDVITVSADIKRTGSTSSQLAAYIYIIPQSSSGQNLAFYSLSYSRPSSSWTGKTLVATMPNNTHRVKILLWNNDYKKNASIAWDNVVVSGPVTDADNDGVADDEDEYPNDATKAFNIYYPNKEEFATLAFEDNWPGKGDYDFNDLVIDYQYKQVINSNNQIVDLYATFDVVAIGASFENGFGFQMGGSPDDINSISGQVFTDNYITTASNGTELGQDKATVIVFDNAYSILPHQGGGHIGVNTETGAEFFDADPVNIHVNFKNPVSQSVNGTAPFNPFIIIDKDRNREAHLSDHAPTSIVDQSVYVGQADDNSIPAEGRFFKTDKNLPWAINIPTSFDYPIEKIQIIDAHLHFAEWAESSGTSYVDWYLEKSGYRNSSNIYQKPE